MSRGRVVPEALLQSLDEAWEIFFLWHHAPFSSSAGWTMLMFGFPNESCAIMALLVSFTTPCVSCLLRCLLLKNLRSLR